MYTSHKNTYIWTCVKYYSFCYLYFFVIFFKYKVFVLKIEISLQNYLVNFYSNFCNVNVSLSFIQFKNWVLLLRKWILRHLAIAKTKLPLYCHILSKVSSNLVSVSQDIQVQRSPKSAFRKYFVSYTQNFSSSNWPSRIVKKCL